MAIDEVYTFNASHVGTKHPFSCIYGLADEDKSMKRQPSSGLFRECVLSKANKAVWKPVDFSICKHNYQGNDALKNPDLVRTSSYPEYNLKEI